MLSARNSACIQGCGGVLGTSARPPVPTVPVAATTRRGGSRAAVRVQALFGWGKDPEKEAEREEQMAIQRERLEQRKTGEKLKEASGRRAGVKRTTQSKREERQREKDLLAQGIMPESLKNWKPYQSKMDEEANSGVVVPLLPFGNQKYDEGERFDLRSPYADDGWVDPEETDAFAGLKNFGKKFLNFSMRREEPGEQKPIIWASKYEQWVQEQKQKREGK